MREEDEDEEDDALDEDDVEELDDTAEEEAALGVDGVRDLTSAAFKLNEDNDEEIKEVETSAAVDSSINGRWRWTS